MKQYLQQTALLDFQHPAIQALIAERGWLRLATTDRALAIYNFVRDEIKFGFNADDKTPASQILSEGYGQCNTKSILFMALLRATGIPCRLHGATVDKQLQSGIMNGELYDMMPKEITHSWVEIFIAGSWYSMEGLILDIPYLSALQQKFADVQGEFSGYGAATADLQNPQIHWQGNNNTYIQQEGIIQDFGLFDNPDVFFDRHPQEMDEHSKRLFEEKYRHQVNNNIDKIRTSS